MCNCEHCNTLSTVNTSNTVNSCKHCERVQNKVWMECTVVQHLNPVIPLITSFRPQLVKTTCQRLQILLIMTPMKVLMVVIGYGVGENGGGYALTCMCECDSSDNPLKLTSGVELHCNCVDPKIWGPNGSSTHSQVNVMT